MNLGAQWEGAGRPMTWNECSCRRGVSKLEGTRVGGEGVHRDSRWD